MGHAFAFFAIPLRDFSIWLFWLIEPQIRRQGFQDVIQCLLLFLLFLEPLYPFHHILKKLEVDGVSKVWYTKVNRAYSIESREYITGYFHPNLVNVVGNMPVLSWLVLLGPPRIMGDVV